MGKQKQKMLIIVISVIIAIITINMFANRNTHAVRKSAKIEIEDVTVYNESINLKFNNTLNHKIYLVNKRNLKEKIEYNTKSQVDLGIEASKIAEGEYYLLSDDKYLTIKSEFTPIEFYTITRDEKNYKITISYDHRAKALLINKVLSELPENSYDIVIDPGHGGDDVGSVAVDGVTSEKDLSLEISKILKVKLEDMGYKVKMTRESDENPGNIENLEEYGKGSRVGIPYEANAKMFISMHYNTGGGSGYEIYSSVNTSNQFVSDVQKQLNQTLNASNKVSYCEQGNCKVPLTYETNDHKDDLIDYFFAVREVGGRSIPTLSEKNIYRQNATGAEGIILESGYIDDYNELATLSDNKTMDKICEQLAKAIDQYIKEQ